jgi:plasmid maintenance system antidote protein VapI
MGWRIAPGELLVEWMLDQEVSAAELADRLGMAPCHLEGIISGETPLEEADANTLEQATGISSRVWLRLESSYRDDPASSPTTFDAIDLPALGDLIVVDGFDHHVYSAFRQHYVDPTGGHRVIELTIRASTQRPEGE